MTTDLRISAVEVTALRGFGRISDKISGIVYDGTEESYKAVTEHINDVLAEIRQESVTFSDYDDGFGFDDGYETVRVRVGDVIIYSYAQSVDEVLTYSKTGFLIEPFEKFATRPFGNTDAPKNDPRKVTGYLTFYISAADEYLRTLDRSSIGAMAVDPSNLLKAVAAIMLDSNFTVSNTEENAIYISLWNAFNGDTSLVAADDTRQAAARATAEALYWFHEGDDPKYWEFAEREIRGDNLGYRLNMRSGGRDDSALKKSHTSALWRAKHNPQYIPYMVAGMRDYPLIERCIENDIDPETALAATGVLHGADNLLAAG